MHGTHGAVVAAMVAAAVVAAAVVATTAVALATAPPGGSPRSPGPAIGTRSLLPGAGVTGETAPLRPVPGHRSGNGRPGRRGPVPAPRAAPAFEAPLLGGGVLDPRTLSGRPALVDFWSSWCGPCRAELAALDRVSRHLAGRVRVVGIDVHDAPGAAEQVLRGAGVHYPQGLDSSGDIAAAFGVVGLPTLVVLDAHGRIAGSRLGRADVAGICSLLDRATPAAQAC